MRKMSDALRKKGSDDYADGNELGNSPVDRLDSL